MSEQLKSEQEQVVARDERANDEDAYLLACEVSVTVFDEGVDLDKEGAGVYGHVEACGRPAVNGFLCVEHSRRARQVDAEEALMTVYGCAPCAKVIVRGFGADGKEYRMLHFNADEGQQAQEMLAQLRRFNERSKNEHIDIVRGPFVLWQSAFEVEAPNNEMKSTERFVPGE